MDFTNYRRTDLAIEETAHLASPCPGVSQKEHKEGDVTITAVSITSRDGSRAIGKPMGEYVTLSFPEFWEEYDNDIEDELKTALAKTLISLFPKNPPSKILVVGLGNRAVTADAIGPFAADRIAVTGHLVNEKALISYLPSCHLFAISPGVVGKTGIETLALVKGALKASGASLVIVIDALASQSVDRLGKTVQLTDSGLVPGSGVGNHRAALNEETLGVPVIAMGVPLVVSSSTLVWDALEKAGIETPNDALVDVLENGKSFFVTLKNCDLACDRLATLLADAINLAVTRLT